MTVRRAALAAAWLLALLVAPLAAGAQQARVYRVGVVYQGGQYSEPIDGLREGLRELGFEEGKQYVLVVRDAKGDLKAAAAAAGSLEADKVDLIYTVTTSVTAAARQATKSVPIVFFAGTDPVAVGLVQSFSKPGGRLTGIYSRSTDLTAKRLELLKEMVPSLHRVVTFYDPDNPAAQQSIKNARDAARQLKVALVERPVASVEKVVPGLRAIRPGEVDAFLYVSGAMVGSQTSLIVEVARAKKLPTMFQERGPVAKGGLASYGLSYHTIGRRSAALVQRVLQGANPGDLPVEALDRLDLTINLKTAKAIGLTVPPSALSQADEVIE